MNTLALAAYVAAAMKAWVPIAEHATTEPAEETVARYDAIARDIAEVVSDDGEAPIFAGPDGRTETALLLASIGSYESHFTARVDACTVAGDHGKAWGLFQTWRPKDVVCASRPAMIRIALGMVRESFAICRSAPLEARLGLYTTGPTILVDGRCKDGNASRWRVGRAIRYWKAHPPGQE